MEISGGLRGEVLGRYQEVSRKSQRGKDNFKSFSALSVAFQEVSEVAWIPGRRLREFHEIPDAFHRVTGSFIGFQGYSESIIREFQRDSNGFQARFKKLHSRFMNFWVVSLPHGPLESF